MFHMLRRQMLRDFRKPLIVMTPKSLLRHKLSVSSLEDLSLGFFQNVIPEIDDLDPARVSRVVFCSGKVYFDLLEERRAREARDVAIVRIEQLYPFPADEYAAILKRYPNLKDVVWCQEEPQNQGAWFQIRHRLHEPLGRLELMYCGRGPSAAPATGIPQLHTQQQQGLVNAALSAHTVEEVAAPPRRLRASPSRKNS
jgi:2-oxoglutarate dehydrogenase E1 component